MNAPELVRRLVDCEERIHALESRIQVMEQTAARAADVIAHEKVIQALNDWRQSFEKPKRQKLTLSEKRILEKYPGACTAVSWPNEMRHSFGEEGIERAKMEGK